MSSQRTNVEVHECGNEVLQCNRVSVEQGSEHATMLGPTPGPKEEHVDNFCLQERVLDVPCRAEEGQTPEEHFVLPRQLELIGAMPAPDMSYINREPG